MQIVSGTDSICSHTRGRMVSASLHRHLQRRCTHQTVHRITAPSSPADRTAHCPRSDLSAPPPHCSSFSVSACTRLCTTLPTASDPKFKFRTSPISHSTTLCGTCHCQLELAHLGHQATHCIHVEFWHQECSPQERSSYRLCYSMSDSAVLLSKYVSHRIYKPCLS